jgi:alpha-tubulin suppressor-like RCC1 family protein
MITGQLCNYRGLVGKSRFIMAEELLPVVDVVVPLLDGIGPRAISWGWGDHGRIGNGITEERNYPLSLDSFHYTHTRAVEVAAGSRHSLILTGSLTQYDVCIR